MIFATVGFEHAILLTVQVSIEITNQWNKNVHSSAIVMCNMKDHNVNNCTEFIGIYR